MCCLTYAQVTADFLNGEVGSARVDNVGKDPLDSNVSSVVFNPYRIDFQRFHRGKSNLRNAACQVRLEVIEGVSQARVELRVTSTALLNEGC